MKQFLAICAVILSLCLPTYPVLAQEQPAYTTLAYPASTAGYVWRLDSANEAALPRNYRQMPSIRMSGSGQPSVLGLAALVQHLEQQGVRQDEIYIIDLRQESHGYFNGNAVSWYGDNNWANAGKSSAYIERLEPLQLGSRSNQNAIIYHLDKNKVPHAALSVTDIQPTTEAQEVQKAGVHYLRLTCTDHYWPQPEEVTKFLSFVQTLPQGAWLHFHCQAGIGRTTSCMAMYDILKNGQHDSLATIMDRQHKLGGQDILHVRSNVAWRQAIFDNKAWQARQFYEEHR